MTNDLSPPRKPVVVIAGPTASGKSAMALDAAEAFGGVIINADSMQVYDTLRIITARPPAHEETSLPHRLYGIVPPDVAFSTGDWLKRASREIEICWQDGQLPIVTGGTGLYIKALCEGLSELPEIPPDIRESVRARVNALGAAKAHGLLVQKDAEMAARIPPTDPQRIARALEVLEATGISLAEHQRASKPSPAVPASFLKIVIEPPREILYARCERRFDEMVVNGALQEAIAIRDLGLDAELPAMKALGLPELLAWARGEIDLEDARVQAHQTTRRFSKRQCTWFRNQMAADEHYFEQYSESLREKIFTKIRDFLLTSPL